MDNWVSQILTGGASGGVMLVAAFLFGLSSAATTAGCGGLPAMLVIIGYSSSTSAASRKRTLFMAAAAFAISTIVVLGLLGVIISFASGSVMDSTSMIGFIVKKILGLVMVILGLSALDWLPMRFPSFRISTEKLPSGILGALLLGSSVGLATAGCAATCSPMQMPLVLGMAALRGKILDGFLILFLFAIGFVAPLVAIMLGAGMTSATKYMARIDKPLRIVTGVFMIVIGLWLCAMYKYTLTGF
ncbi:MAG: hypothetical protein FWH42_05010 [Dehalococcoidia bacterium]|nr:hypothetical protein [Dehalococcoidia bacterium]